MKCKYCKKKINKTKDTDYKAVKNKFAHLACIVAEEQREKTDEEKFYIYIIDLFKIEDDFVPLRIKKQAKDFIEKYNYTYSGMLKALKYFYEIKHNDISKSNNGIGIIPYVYEESKEYWYTRERQQKGICAKLEEQIRQTHR